MRPVQATRQAGAWATLARNGPLLLLAVAAVEWAVLGVLLW